jgi:ornithine cyclodeaminase
MMMRSFDADEIAALLTYEALIDALAEAFRSGVSAPARHHHTIPQRGTDATLLLMPAWTQAHVPDNGDPAVRKGHAQNEKAGEPFIGCKILSVFPDNAKHERPSVYGSYLLLAGATGEPLAIMDGTALTAWRTAAASALAARHLARADARHLVMIGAGAVAPHLVRAHAAARPIERVTVFNRSRAKAVSLAFALSVAGIETSVSEDLEASVREADIVSCATLSSEPLINGAWLKKGTHVDLVGGFTPRMREADDAAIKRARIYVDTRAGALKEAGDIVVPLRRKLIAKEDIQGDLFDLCGGKAKGRQRASEITLFKSVGSAIEDLAAAMLVWRLANRP